ncbi:hypothetical protein CEXT_301591 [Caerostris extrusa]|uniref:Uncharacterized protein n=1 Tax=Caerostris extrusa TaxID=172846 RepID=A0AAV4SY45_CAEEX|nr:hypothetical protein CEXT_301591 [Caerostris extrusa]
MYFSVPGENGIVREETSPGDKSIKEGVSGGRIIEGEEIIEEEQSLLFLPRDIALSTPTPESKLEKGSPSSYHCLKDLQWFANWGAALLELDYSFLGQE